MTIQLFEITSRIVKSAIEVVVNLFAKENIYQKLPNYLETHDKFWSSFLFSNNLMYFTI